MLYDTCFTETCTDELIIYVKFTYPIIYMYLLHMNDIYMVFKETTKNQTVSIFKKNLFSKNIALIGNSHLKHNPIYLLPILSCLYL